MPITVRYDVPAELSGGASYQAGWAEPMSRRLAQQEERGYSLALQQLQRQQQEDDWQRNRDAQLSDAKLKRQWELENMGYSRNMQLDDRASQQEYAAGQDTLQRSRQLDDRAAQQEYVADQDTMQRQRQLADRAAEQGYAGQVRQEEWGRKDQQRKSDLDLQKSEQQKNLKNVANALWFEGKQMQDPELSKAMDEMARNADAGVLSPEAMTAALQQMIERARAKTSVQAQQKSAGRDAERQKMEAQLQQRREVEARRQEEQDNETAIRMAQAVAGPGVAVTREDIENAKIQIRMDRMAKAPIDDLLSGVSAGDVAAAKTIVARAKAGDPQAIMAMERIKAMKAAQARQ